MEKQGDQLREMKAQFRIEERDGNYREASRYANKIANSLKDAGSYHKALKWLKRDYGYTNRAIEQQRVKTRRSPCAGQGARSESQDDGDLQRDLLATLQSLGEIHLRLNNFHEATSYMERHYELAKEMQDAVEQQRSSTQLGRAYFESFSRGDPAVAGGGGGGAAIEAALEQQAASMRALMSARKYLQRSLQLAEELADAYNNVGLLFEETESLEEAVNCFSRGLEVCDDEEIGSVDETRTRLHNSLGRVFTRSCQWERARQHIDMDVKICERLNNAVGCAKAWINKGDFSFKMEEYDEAQRAFERAREIARQMEDEASLVAQCEGNLEAVHGAKRQRERCEQLWAQHRKTQRLLERARSSEERQKLFAEGRGILKDLMDIAEGALARLTRLKAAEEYVRLGDRAADTLMQCEAAEAMADACYNLH
ncbi:hypothetical protein CLOM_g8816, partial [Closterium sp. NIES-68]